MKWLVILIIIILLDGWLINSWEKDFYKNLLASSQKDLYAMTVDIEADLYRNRNKPNVEKKKDLRRIYILYNRIKEEIRKKD